MSLKRTAYRKPTTNVKSESFRRDFSLQPRLLSVPGEKAKDIYDLGKIQRSISINGFLVTEAGSVMLFPNGIETLIDLTLIPVPRKVVISSLCLPALHYFHISIVPYKSNLFTYTDTSLKVYVAIRNAVSLHGTSGDGRTTTIDLRLNPQRLNAGQLAQSRKL